MKDLRKEIKEGCLGWCLIVAGASAFVILTVKLLETL